MEIAWFGHSCFSLADNRGVVVTDPFDDTLGYPTPQIRADIVTISHDNPHHNYLAAIQGDFQIVRTPGEYEIKSVFLTGIATYPSQKNKSNPLTEADRNIVFVFEFDGLTICHLGDLAQVPSQAQVQSLSDVDVLLVPIGGGGHSLNAAKAAEVISLIEPLIVIPMHYELDTTSDQVDHAQKFLKEMGVAQIEPVERLKVSKSGLPQETQVILLEPKAGGN